MSESGRRSCPRARVVERNGSGTDLTPTSLGSPDRAVASAPAREAQNETDSGYVFPTWRAALADSQMRIGDAYAYRARLFQKAHEAGLSYREIGEATGLSAAAIGKVLGKQRRATLNDQANA